MFLFFHAFFLTLLLTKRHRVYFRFEEITLLKRRIFIFDFFIKWVILFLLIFINLRLLFIIWILFIFDYLTRLKLLILLKFWNIFSCFFLFFITWWLSKTIICIFELLPFFIYILLFFFGRFWTKFACLLVIFKTKYWKYW